jgi:ubiquinone/menaquinone biosynthesis C-methylase UbiE
MAESQARSANYTLGHDDVALQAHNARTAKVAADYLLPHIRPDDQILDIGCGPGSITVGLAERAPNGRTIGIDYSSTAVEAAKKTAEEPGAPKNIEFRKGNAFDLDWKGETFDIVHAHQCLIHLADPVQALREMKRVCKTKKVVGVREGKPSPFS